MSQLKTMQDENLPIWLPRLALHGGPHFLRIADALQAAVVDGSLKPGDRLAQISLMRSGAFWPTTFSLFQGM
jgi:hypothetical protein